MTKLLAVLAFALFSAASRTQDLKQDNYTATAAEIAAQAYTYTHAVPNDTSTIHYFAFQFDAVPGSLNISVAPCSGSPTDAVRNCSSPVLLSQNAQKNPIAIVPVYGTFAYYDVTVTWTGSVAKASVGITGLN